jgi:imidazole glycerol-phosphate synthase subunit HisH
MGNVRSMHNALDMLGIDAVVTADPDVIATAERLILPGVGAFGDAMGNLRTRGLVEVLSREVLEKRKPFLGVCLGMQLLARSSSEHGTHEGLGWFDADVVRFDLPHNGLKVPHMGWNDVATRKVHPLLHGLREDQFVFYFVHSFHVVCRDSDDVVADCEYGYPFAAAIARDNIFATQFHPEKSQDNGLQILRNFSEWAP